MTTPAIRQSARDRVAAFIADDTKVSPAQRAAVEHPGNLFLDACPGGGKTRTIGVRAAWAAVDGTRRIVAATSYTNTAVREIQRAAVLAGSPIAAPHFVGTLHSFLLRYVFHPFGHLAMKCEPPARMIFGDFHRPHDPHAYLEFENKRPKPPGIPVWDYDFRADGTIAIKTLPYTVTLDADEVIRRTGAYVVEQKRELAAKGIASPSDAMYYALEVLRQQPAICDAVASRFDEVIVDEVQDTTAVQLACLRELHASGHLKSLVLAGDLEQAIYEWAGSRPEDLERFVAERGLETLRLEENFRSSQRLCDVAFRFSRRAGPDVAVGEHRDLQHLPELYLYDDVQDAVTYFERRLEELGIDANRARVLCRSTGLQERLRDVKALEMNRTIRLLGRAAVPPAADRPAAINRHTVEELERLFKSLVWKVPPVNLTFEERLALRDALMHVLELLPDVNLDLADWIPQARSAVKTGLAVFEPLEVQPGTRIKVMPKMKGVKAVDAFGRPSENPFEPLTVHTVKGETHDAVLLVGGRTKNHDHGAQWLKSATASDGREEVRIAYVALTRAAKFVVVALPADTESVHVDEYIHRGFISADSPPS